MNDDLLDLGFPTQEDTVLDDKDLERELRKQVLSAKFDRREDLTTNLNKLDVNELTELIHDLSLLETLGFGEESNVGDKVLTVLVEKKFEVSNSKYKDFVNMALASAALAFVLLASTVYIMRYVSDGKLLDNVVKVFALLLL
jgi:hypothetical protein